MPAAPGATLSWPENDVVAHELVHALFDMPDIYAGDHNFATWFDLMNFTVGTEYPVVISSFVREWIGICSIRNLPRQDHHRLALPPLESHNTACRFQNGACHDAQSIVVEHRRRYNFASNPPPRLSNAMFAYRCDLRARMRQTDGTRFRAGVIARGGAWGDAWGTATGQDLLDTGVNLGNTLSANGEHWWSLRNVRFTADEMMEFDAVYEPFDLIRAYQSASWLNSQGRPLRPNASLGAAGHVAMVARSRPIAGHRRYDHVLSVHPDWVLGGLVEGGYRVQVPASGARLYVTVALSEQATRSDGVDFEITVDNGLRVQGTITPQRNLRTFAVDLRDLAGRAANISLIVRSRGSTYQDWVYIVEAVLVPTAPALIDLFDRCEGAGWYTNAGRIGFGGAISPQGHARWASSIALQNGVIYGSRVTFIRRGATTATWKPTSRFRPWAATWCSGPNSAFLNRAP